MNAKNLIDTGRFSTMLRSKSIKTNTKEILLSRFEGSEQEDDITDPINCHGIGRVRHFCRTSSAEWPDNPLPIVPAGKALHCDFGSTMKAQVFQNAACNWRCWYCYVPFALLNADEDKSKWVSATKLIELYCSEESCPSVIDLSGGQPDLVPEWVPWIMEELLVKGLDESTYLWSDDNLSNDYFWVYLSDKEIERIANYKNYGRVCCFKGFNNDSFSFNTRAQPELFDHQFKLFSRLLTVGMDIYAYATFTSPSAQNIADDVARFVDRLQAIHPNLPLRTVPLEVKMYSTVQHRLATTQTDALVNQCRAIDAWNIEIERRFHSDVRSMPITEISLWR